MIGFLTGRIHDKQPPFLWLDVMGVGYEIEAPMSTFYALPDMGETALVYIHTHVREDALLLYGFATEAEKRLYRTLIKANGVGAKMALAILSSMSVSEFVQLVQNADSVGLTRIPGVGKKTADRLVIEMRDRLKELSEFDLIAVSAANQTPSQAQVANAAQQSAIAALVSLGYKASQAENMVAEVAKESEEYTLEQLIKLALQNVRL